MADVATMTLRAQGPVAADVAWDRYARPALWPVWAPQITDVACSAERLTTGATGRVRGPLGITVDFVVDRWDDAARTWSWTARRGLLRMRLDHGVEARHNGCATWLRLRGALPELAVYAPVAKLALHRLVHADG